MSATTYTASVNGVTGLYDIGGGLTTSSVDINTIQYTLEYDYTHTSTSTYPIFGYYSGFGTPAGWQTTLRVNFTNTNWQTAPATSTFWVQVCNYLAGYDAPTATSTLSWELDYFLSPIIQPLVSIGSGGYVAVKTFSVVNPRPFSVASLSIDPADPTGKTGKITWFCTPTAPYPWGDIMAFPSQQVVTYANGSSTSFMGVLWAYARPTANGIGGCSISNRGITYPYVIPPDLGPLMAKKESKRDSLAEALAMG